MIRLLFLSCVAVLLSLIVCPQDGAGEPVLTVSLKEFNAEGHAVFTLANVSGRDIDDLKAGFQITDAEGDHLYSTALSDQTPGLVFMRAGESMDYSPFGLKHKPEVLKLLRSDPGSCTLTMEVREVMYMDAPR